ncbi:MAG: SDR family NAD(P)-dependent oxidoreductase [Dehalococcoidales bacterium]
MKLESKVAIIVGGAGGIGRVTSKLLAKEDAKVMIADMDIEIAEQVADEIKSGGGEAAAVKVDMTKTDETEAMAKAVLERYGQIDILVNLAGGSVGKFIREKLGPFSESKKEVWDRIIDINLNGARNCSRAVINHMIERGSGKIINISSTAGVTGLRNAVDYSAAKAGIIGFTKALALEVTPLGIQVSCVTPGGVATPRIEEMFTKAMAEANQQAPVMDMSRLTQPEEIANTILFLVSDEVRSLSGENIIVARTRGN